MLATLADGLRDLSLARTTDDVGHSGGLGEKSVLLRTMARIFIAQSKIDAWLAAGRVHLEQSTLRVPAGGSSVTLGIDAAVFVERIDGGDPDVHKIAGKVKTAAEVVASGGELYDTSLVLGDYAYTVKPGFVATYRPGAGMPPRLDTATWAKLRAGLLALG